MKLLNILLLIVTVFLFAAPFAEPQTEIKAADTVSSDCSSQLKWDNDTTIGFAEDKNTVYIISSRNIEEDTRQGEEIGKSRNIIGLVMDGLALEIAYLIPPLRVNFSSRDSMPEIPPPKYSA